MWRWLEHLLDRIIPVVEERHEMAHQASAEELAEIIRKIASENGLRIRHSDSSEHILQLPGRTVGELSQMRSLIGDVQAKRYRSLKSRFKISQNPNGAITVISYEHIVRFPEEESALQQVMRDRLDFLVGQLDSYLGSDRDAAPSPNG